MLSISLGMLNALIGVRPILSRYVASILAECVSVRGKCAVLVDGGNTADPYELVEASKRRRRTRSETREVLERVRVARAFTVYQLDTLVMCDLAKELEHTDAGLVVIAHFPEMFGEIDAREAEALARRMCARIEELSNNVQTVVTAQNVAPIGKFHWLSRAYKKIELDEDESNISVTIEGVMHVYPAHRHQTSLEQFEKFVNGNCDTTLKDSDGIAAASGVNI